MKYWHQYERFPVHPIWVSKGLSTGLFPSAALELFHRQYLPRPNWFLLRKRSMSEHVSNVLSYPRAKIIDQIQNMVWNEKSHLSWRIGELPLRWICYVNINSLIFPFLICIWKDIMVKWQNSKHSIFLPVSKLEFSYTITVHMLHFGNDTTTIVQMPTQICYWQWWK